MQSQQSWPYSRPLVLDGAAGTFLEAQGAMMHPELWSSGVLLSKGGEDALRDLHQAYIDAGADVITAVTYQSSVPALMKASLSEKESLQFMTRTVEIAKEEAAKATNSKKVYVAAGLGPYGAYLCNGAEYTGVYEPSTSYDVLKEFWIPRVEAVLAAQPDILLLETIPNITELRVILSEIVPMVNNKRIPIWISLSLQIPDADEGEVKLADGTPLELVAESINAPETAPIQVIGANCFDVRAVPRVIESLQCMKRPILVYPNSGEVYNGSDKSWHTLHESKSTANVWQPAQWIARGVTAVGGCCRTTPEIIKAIAQDVTGTTNV